MIVSYLDGLIEVLDEVDNSELVNSWRIFNGYVIDQGEIPDSQLDGNRYQLQGNESKMWWIYRDSIGRDDAFLIKEFIESAKQGKTVTSSMGRRVRLKFGELVVTHV
ncbi:hypothetical protein A134_23035 [Vibrio crassostreae 9CS106]|uniref:Uncharacterized protein n=1 Tax=Vibrio crassostreae 9CS106 TaxID=1191300 RepID=A0A1B1C354_9VIBR|nr:hypothetical protein A134_23035 [Vibrio crassostreae 9CS106]